MTVKLIPYLIMDGNAQEAIKFYEETLDAQILFSQTYGDFADTPENANSKNLIMHACIQIGESNLMLSDTYPGYPHQTGNQVTICISTNDIEKSRHIFEGLSKGGQVELPLQDTGFSPAYGKVVDKFGVLFQVFTEGNQ
ncbi:VOC family protein [Gottfriedia solisilvae]|uniref:VOC family protein n=1 Tax=Gottfriedia solisilvae TaxID=1516104 RepID=A0A8J3EWY5_9BACI|nr:VOC family protein [Gottfriedia solisilvae]GGI11144.1 VOC family protein [Gottfriedia solisilvae]